MYIYGSYLVAQTRKNLPAMQETWVQSLDWEDPLEKGMATHSNILAWEIPRTEEPGGLQSMGSQRTGHYQTTNTCTMYIYICKYIHVIICILRFTQRQLYLHKAGKYSKRDVLWAIKFLKDVIILAIVCLDRIHRDKSKNEMVYSEHQGDRMCIHTVKRLGLVFKVKWAPKE